MDIVSSLNTLRASAYWGLTMDEVVDDGINCDFMDNRGGNAPVILFFREAILLFLRRRGKSKAAYLLYKMQNLPELSKLLRSLSFRTPYNTYYMKVVSG
jgi:hypothetical protein